MKKVLLLCMAVCLLILGCEKEGVYNPSKKIKRISTQSQNDSKRLESEWTWEKNLLKKIQYYTYSGSSAYDERYMYDKNKLVKVEENDGYYTKITYNGDKYDKMEYFNPQGTILESQKFTYNNNKVSQIDNTIYNYGEYKSMQDRGFISHFLSSEMVSVISRMISKSPAKSTEQHARITYKYDKENISESYAEINEEFYSSKATITFEKYDKSINPWYHSFIDVVGSKNNPLEVIAKFEITLFDEFISQRMTVSYEYEYDGKFPTEIYATQRQDNESYRATTFIDYK
jgi:hypothetical protein